MPERDVKLNVTANDKASDILNKINASLGRLAKTAEVFDQSTRASTDATVAATEVTKDAAAATEASATIISESSELASQSMTEFADNFSENANKVKENAEQMADSLSKSFEKAKEPPKELTGLASVGELYGKLSEQFSGVTDPIYEGIGGTVEKVADLSTGVDELTGKFKGLGDTIIESKEAADFSGTLGQFFKLSEASDGLIGTIVTLTKTVVEFGKALKAAAANPITVIVAGIVSWVSVIQTVYTEWQFFVDEFKEGMDELKNVLTSNPLYRFFESLAKGIGVVGKAVKEAFGSLGEEWQNIKQSFTGGPIEAKTVADTNSELDKSTEAAREYQKLKQENIKLEISLGYSVAKTNVEYKARVDRMNELAATMQNVDVLESVDATLEEADKQLDAAENFVDGFSQLLTDFGIRSAEEAKRTLGLELPATFKDALEEMNEDYNAFAEQLGEVPLGQALKSFIENMRAFKDETAQHLITLREKWEDFNSTISASTGQDAKSSALSQYVRGILTEYENVLNNSSENITAAWQRISSAALASDVDVKKTVESMKAVLQEGAQTTEQYINRMTQLYQSLRSQLLGVNQSLQNLRQQTDDQLAGIEKSAASARDQIVMRTFKTQGEQQAFLQQRTIDELNLAKELAASSNKKDVLEAQQIYKDVIQRATQLKDASFALVAVDKAREGAARTTVELEKMTEQSLKKQQSTLTENIDLIKQRLEELKAEQLQIKIELNEESLTVAVNQINESAQAMREALSVSLEDATAALANAEAGKTQNAEKEKAGITAEEAAEVGKVMTDSFDAAMQKWVGSAPPVKVDVRVHQDGRVSASKSGGYDELG